MLLSLGLSRSFGGERTSFGGGPIGSVDMVAGGRKGLGYKTEAENEADFAAGKCFDYMVGGCWVKRSRRRGLVRSRRQNFRRWGLVARCTVLETSWFKFEVMATSNWGWH